MSTQLPAGRYLSCLTDIHPAQGGQTRAALMRTRLLRAEAGIDSTLMTFTAAPDYERRREVLLDSGLLLPGTGFLNVYDYYRDHAWAEPLEDSAPLQDLRDHQTGQQNRPDGTPWRNSFLSPDTGLTSFDYLRPDGTTYLRIPRYSLKDTKTWPTAIQQVSPDGVVVGQFPSLGDWFRGWLRHLCRDDERSFIFVDSRHLVPRLLPMKDPDKYLIYVLHNVHVRTPRRWDSPIAPLYGQVLSRISAMDGFVTLTTRQHEDVAERCGATNNMFVVPNPVDLTPMPKTKVQRDPLLATVVARLEPQKRLDHAVAAFAQVLESIPDARLEIHGAGSRRAELVTEIARRGLSRSVTLLGFDPHARQALWRSSAFLMTSQFEGYPLATLESFSHGCPVVSYDIKYGPREQITDGVDGFLVPDGDISGLADRVVRLLESPTLVRDMGVAARKKAAAHGADRFLQDWTSVLSAVVDQKSRRCVIEDVQLEVTSLESGRLPDFAGVLRMQLLSGSASLDTVRVELSAVYPRTGRVVDLPVDVRRQQEELQINTRPVVEDLPVTLGPEEPSYLRLRVVLQNAVWQTRVPWSSAPGTPS